MGNPQTAGCLEIGEQLSSEGTRNALTIGIGQIDSVRILIEGEVSFLGNPGLLPALLEKGLGAATAITCGHGIFLSIRSFLRLELKLASRWRLVANDAINDTANSLVDWLCRRLLGSKGRRIIWLSIAIPITGLTLMNNEADGQRPTEKRTQGLTCNIDGIPPQDRARYAQLFESLRHAIQDKRDLPDGYALRLDPAQLNTDQALEWIELERKCCPFLEMEIRWDIQNGPVWLDLKGPEGVKDFVLDEFGLR
jgi:hypothetical protein